MLKKIIAVGGLIILGLLGYLIIKSRPKELRLTIVPDSNNYVSLKSEQAKIDFIIYVNQNNSYLTDLNSINRTYIADVMEDNLYSLQITQISYLNEVAISQNQYYRYQFSFTSDSLEESFYLDKAYLILEYNVCKVKMYIGSFSSYKLDSYDSPHLRINYLKGIVNSNQDKKILVGVILGFKKEINKKIIITRITPLNDDTKINHYELFDKEVTSQTNINELVSISYDINDCYQETTQQEVINDQKLLCTLGYCQIYEINTLGFQIDYLVDNKSYTMYYNPFTFYENYEQYVKISDLTFYNIPND